MHSSAVHKSTYLLIPWHTILLELLTGFQLVKKFPVFYRTRRFITAIAGAHQLVPIMSQFYPIYTRTSHFLKIYIFILSSRLRLGLPNGLFPSGFPTKTLYTSLLSPHTCYMHRPYYSSRFDHSNFIR